MICIYIQKVDVVSIISLWKCTPVSRPLFLPGYGTTIRSRKDPLGRCERAGNAADFHRAHLQMGVVIIVMPAPSPTSSKLNVLQTSGHRRKRGFPRNSDFKVWGCPHAFDHNNCASWERKNLFATVVKQALSHTKWKGNTNHLVWGEWGFPPSPSPSLIQVQPPNTKQSELGGSTKVVCW